jgi:hypothetical protein
MTLQDIVDASRDALGNYEKPYRYLDREIVLWTNDAMNEIAREARLFVDASTGSACNVHTAANVADYALSGTIVYINSARRYSSELMTLDVAPTPASFAAGATVTGGTSTKTCTVVECLTSTTYTVDHRSGEFTLGEILSDGTNSGDQGTSYPTFADNSTAGWELDKETNIGMNKYTPGWRNVTATAPTKFVLDYRYGYITFYPTPDAIYTVNLAVIKYPAVLTTTSMSSQTPEIPSQYHSALIDGICYRAWLKPGENTYDPNKSSIHAGLFRNSIAKIKRETVMFRANDSTLSPVRGFV